MAAAAAAASALAHSANTDINSPADAFVAVKDAAWVLYSGLWPDCSGLLEGSVPEKKKTIARLQLPVVCRCHAIHCFYLLLISMCLLSGPFFCFLIKVFMLIKGFWKFVCVCVSLMEIFVFVFVFFWATVCYVWGKSLREFKSKLRYYRRVELIASFDLVWGCSTVKESLCSTTGLEH